ncbi:Aldehyde/histidinol dehydrogenase [Trichoderma novae-zelandiae]
MCLYGKHYCHGWMILSRAITVLLSPSHSPLMTLLMKPPPPSDAGLLKGVYTNIFATVPPLHSSVEDFRVRGVTWTGSERAGAVVAKNAGRYSRKTVLKLGGSDPLIILPDASVEDATKAAVASRMFNTGQGCAASERVNLGGRDCEREANNGMKKAMAELKPGDPLDPRTSLGAVVSERGLDGLLAQIVKLPSQLVLRLLSGGSIASTTGSTSSPDLPFGGIKNSGLGKEVSELGFSEFTNKKLVRVAD